MNRIALTAAAAFAFGGLVLTGCPEREQVSPPPTAPPPAAETAPPPGEPMPARDIDPADPAAPVEPEQPAPDDGVGM